MRLVLLIICSLVSSFTMAQGINLGSGTTLNVERNAVFYFGGGATFNGPITNQGVTIVESDGQMFSSVNNQGTLQIKGDAAMDAASTLSNAAGASVSIEGNASLNGTIANDGDFLVRGALSSVVNGNIDNNSQLGFETNVQLNGTIDNTGGTLGVTGNAEIAGTLLNPDGATTAVEGALTLKSAFTNGGVLTTNGEVIVEQNFTNSNEVVFAGPTTFEADLINDNTVFFGTTASFNGGLTNTGEITSFGDGTINFGSNRPLGTLNFVDVVDRDPIDAVTIASDADSIFINQLNLNTAGTITLPPNFVLVQTAMNIQMGVINATNQETFLVQGPITVNNANTGAPSYVEGTMLAITSSDASTTFPMGINGAPNYVTLNSNTADVVVRVECKVPNPDSLLTDENTMGLAQQVEWSIQAADSADVAVSVSYSGVDFTNSPNFINAREYDATLQKYAQGDTVFQALSTVGSINDNDGTLIPTQGTIQTSDRVWITTSPTRFALGLSPVLTEPEVYLPNVFTPGASMNENKVFRPFIGGAVVSSVTFQIFDSFNKEVYVESIAGEDIDLEGLGWDGNLKNGSEAPGGVYYYSISIDYSISNEVSDKYFTSGERDQTQNFNRLGSVLLVK